MVVEQYQTFEASILTWGSTVGKEGKGKQIGAVGEVVLSLISKRTFHPHHTKEVRGIHILLYMKIEYL